MVKQAKKTEENKRDSYIEMLKAFTPEKLNKSKSNKKLKIEDMEDAFVKWGKSEIEELLPDRKLVEEEWKALCKKINNNKNPTDLEKNIRNRDVLEGDIENLNQNINELKTTIGQLSENDNKTKRDSMNQELGKLKKNLKDKKKEKADFLNKFCVFVRGYGRNKKESRELLQKLYLKAGFNVIVEIDSTNNAEPHNLMNNININYTTNKSSNEDNKTLLQNYTLSHIWGFTKNIYLFNCPWNIIYTPHVIDPFTGHESASSALRNKMRNALKELINDKYGEIMTKYNKIIKEKKNVFYNACDDLIKEDQEHKKFYEEMKKQWAELENENMFEKKKNNKDNSED